MIHASERFERHIERIPESGCWIWLGAVDGPPRLPYGKFWDNDYGRCIVAHRAAWKLFRGDIPDSLRVLHRCDVACCVNPAHLFLGTPKDNTADMIAKGRNAPMIASRRGERSNFNKLSAEQVEAIRNAAGTQREIAAAYGINQASVSLIKRRINWKHL